MKTQILKEHLAEATGAVRDLVAKDCLSPFSRVRLDVVGPNVSLTGTNGDVQIEYRLNGETGEDGTLALPGGPLVRFVDAMPPGMVNLDGKAGKQATITANAGVKFSLSAADAMDYPVMAGPKAGCGSIDVDALVMKEMLRKVKFAADPDGSGRPHLCGVNVKFKDGKLEMTATDGRRLAHVEKDLVPGGDAPKAPDNGVNGPEFDIILANKAVKILFGLLENDEFLTIAADREGARLTSDKWNLTTRGVNGKFPEWHNVVPKDMAHRARIDRGSFLVAMERAALCVREDNAVKLSLKNGQAKFEARNDLSHASSETILCSIDDGAKATFMFNYRLLKDALEAIDDDEFMLYFGEDAFSRVVLKCSIPWLTVIMPLRIDEKKEV